MAGLIDMANSPAEIKKEQGVTTPVSLPVPAYPWGLNVRLEQDTLDKLSLDASDVSVGDTLHVNCLMKVTATSERENVGADGAKENYKCVELQITHMGLSDIHDEEDKEPQRKYGRPLKYNAE